MSVSVRIQLLLEVELNLREAGFIHRDCLVFALRANSLAVVFEETLCWTTKEQQNKYVLLSGSESIDPVESISRRT